jgi:hypothetical protein
MTRLSLPSVTLIAATSVNVTATIAALELSMQNIAFKDCIIMTDADPGTLPAGLRHVGIAPMRSAEAYSAFMLRELVRHIASEHVLVCQWDGFVANPSAWDESFLAHDYIGALWPQFDDLHNVGNGGFSLRSRRLLEACLDPDFMHSHPEDLAICRWNRRLLESAHHIRFASDAVAARFSIERGLALSPTFGFHGIFNMVEQLGADRFWQLYQSLDHRSLISRDYRLLIKQLSSSPGFLKRAGRLSLDRIRDMLGLGT